MKYRELGNTGLKVVKSGNIEVLMFSVNPCYDLLYQPSYLSPSGEKDRR